MLCGESDQALREALSRAEGQPFLLENLVTVDGGTLGLAAGARGRRCQPS